jgi:hypothetical protein
MEKNRELKHPFINPNNEIKISELTDVHETIDFIMELFTKKNYQTIKISGLNKAIKKVVLITEIVKSKIPGLHQINEINTLYKKNNKIYPNDINNEDGMPIMSIKLTFVEPSEEEKNNMGYQRPLNAIEASMISKYRNNINNEDYE